MPLKIYNSLTKQKDFFQPSIDGKVRMYVCGPTVYDEPHIGHLRSAYVFTVAKRYMEHACGWPVDMVRNITDVDDKIIEKARALGSMDLEKAAVEVSSKYYEMYRKALEELGIKYGECLEPRASDSASIRAMQDLIQQLISKNYAYENHGDVYFNVENFAEYGDLSGQQKNEMLEGVRIEPNENKRSALDFALWKKAKENEPAWVITLNIDQKQKQLKGRPGWHIECSAMSGKYLGEEYGGNLPFDIHGGGRDLIFPHHENEIAQTKAATGKDLARFWMHHGLITINGQKMSKSLNNYITLEDIRRLPGMQPWGIETLKFLFLGTHYRAPLDYTREHMQMAHSVFKNFYYFFEEAADYQKEGCEALNSKLVDELLKKFYQAMSDDFNTSLAISTLIEVLHLSRKTIDPQIILYAAQQIDKILSDFFCLESMLSFFKVKDLIDIPKELLDAEKERLKRAINGLMQKRKDARTKKDYKASDELREQLVRIGSELYNHEMELVDLKNGNSRLRHKI